MPAWLLWYTPIIVLTSLAVVWTIWAARPRGPVKVMTSVEAHERFRAALSTPVPAPRQGRGSWVRARR